MLTDLATQTIRDQRLQLGGMRASVITQLPGDFPGRDMRVFTRRAISTTTPYLAPSVQTRSHHVNSLP